MNKILRKNIVAIILPITLLGMPSCAVIGSADSEGRTQHVDGVMWNNKKSIDFKEVLKQEVASDKTRLVFIRKNDNHSEQTSTNISINNRFQVSLHANNYTVVDSCVGSNQLSAQATGFKNNNLLADSKWPCRCGARSSGETSQLS